MLLSLEGDWLTQFVGKQDVMDRETNDGESNDAIYTG